MEVKEVVVELVKEPMNVMNQKVLRAMVESPYDVPETIMRQHNISQEEWEEAVGGPGFIDDLFERSLRLLAAPHIPGILKSMFEGAADGNESKAKLALQLLDKLKPDSVANFNFGSYSNDDLVNRLETLKQQLAPQPQEVSQDVS